MSIGFVFYHSCGKCFEGGGGAILRYHAKGDSGAVVDGARPRRQMIDVKLLDIDPTTAAWVAGNPDRPPMPGGRSSLILRATPVANPVQFLAWLGLGGDGGRCRRHPVRLARRDCLGPRCRGGRPRALQCRPAGFGLLLAGALRPGDGQCVDQQQATPGEGPTVERPFMPGDVKRRRNKNLAAILLSDTRPELSQEGHLETRSVVQRWGQAQMWH